MFLPFADLHFDRLTVRSKLRQLPQLSIVASKKSVVLVKFGAISEIKIALGLKNRGLSVLTHSDSELESEQNREIEIELSIFE